jgi:hypothetical protein
METIGDRLTNIPSIQLFGREGVHININYESNEHIMRTYGREIRNRHYNSSRTQIVGTDRIFTNVNPECRKRIIVTNTKVAQTIGKVFNNILSFSDNFP